MVFGVISNVSFCFSLRCQGAELGGGRCPSARYVQRRALARRGLKTPYNAVIPLENTPNRNNIKVFFEVLEQGAYLYKTILVDLLLDKLKRLFKLKIV